MYPEKWIGKRAGANEMCSLWPGHGLYQNLVTQKCRHLGPLGSDIGLRAATEYYNNPTWAGREFVPRDLSLNPIAKW